MRDRNNRDSEENKKMVGAQVMKKQDRAREVETRDILSR